MMTEKMIEIDTIAALINEAGVVADNVQQILITPQKVEFTLMVRIPTEDGSLGNLMLHDDCFMLIKKIFDIHRPGDHIHEEDVVLDHTHE